MLLVVVLLLVAGCGSAPRSLAGTDDQGISPVAPDSPLAAVDAPWVEFEARWVCDLERTVYDDPADVDAALAERLHEADIDPAAYSAFKDRLQADADLALHVQAAVVDRCGD